LATVEDSIIQGADLDLKDQTVFFRRRDEIYIRIGDSGPIGDDKSIKDKVYIPTTSPKKINKHASSLSHSHSDSDSFSS